MQSKQGAKQRNAKRHTRRREKRGEALREKGSILYEGCTLSKVDSDSDSETGKEWTAVADKAHRESVKKAKEAKES